MMKAKHYIIVTIGKKQRAHSGNVKAERVVKIGRVGEPTPPCLTVSFKRKYNRAFSA